MKNNNLEPVKLPMKIKFGVPAKTEFKVLEDEIKVKLVDGPTMNQLLEWVPEFVTATWMDEYTEKNMTLEEKIENITKAFKGQTLPTVLENVRFTFLVTGMTYIEVSHMLRHRNFSVSAFCSGDTFLHEASVMIPESINNSPEFKERYEKVMSEAKELYADMVNSKRISIMDARYALPVSRFQGYYFSMCYKDLVAFVKQRIDRAIQPKSDNLIAYQMWVEACKRLPFLAKLDIIDFDVPSWFFINTSRSGHSTNLYIPEEHNDKFEWNEKDFLYQCTRDELNGTENIESTFSEKIEYYKNELNKIKKQD